MEWNPSRIGPRWRKAIADAIWPELPRNWLPAHDLDAHKMVSDALSRLLDAMTGGGTCGLVECGRDGILCFRRLPTGQLVARGDYRYSPDVMAEFLEKNPDRDLVPIVVGKEGKEGNRWRVLDGHHRMRAYEVVQRNVPAILCFTEPGTGLIRLI